MVKSYIVSNLNIIWPNQTLKQKSRSLVHKWGHASLCFILYFRLKRIVYVLLFNNGFFQVDRKKNVYWSDTTNFLIDSLSYLDEVEYCLRLKARLGRPTQLWPQSDSWRTPNGLERPLCAKEFHHPILWHKREKQKSWILMNDKAIATKAALLPK